MHHITEEDLVSEEGLELEELEFVNIVNYHNMGLHLKVTKSLALK